MAVSITLYQSFNAWKADGTFDMNSDTFKVSLHTSTYAPNAATHTVYADLTNELSTANGYTSGGGTMAGVTWVHSGAVATFDANDQSWTASGGSIGPARYAVIRKSGTANGRVDPLVGYVDFGADNTATDGNPFTIQWNASGIFTDTLS